MKSWLLRPSRAFTLVELLVVIGIIALLISILLPALGAARRAANTVKCGAALREIGSAMRLYANDNKGFYPAAMLLLGANKSYEINRVMYYNGTAPSVQTGITLSTGNIYWYDFLAKYITQVRTGAAANDQGQLKRTIFWACPEWSGYPTNGSAIADPAMIQTGYGMNTNPGFDGTITPYNVVADTDASTSVNSQTRAWIKDWGIPTSVGASRPGAPVTITGQIGNFRPATTFGRNGANRILVADSMLWSAESLQVPSSGVLPPQRAVQYTTLWVSNDAQTLIDIYRHGKRPGSADAAGLTVALVPKNVKFNALYCDNSVRTESAPDKAFSGIRMKFPG
ncbi:MAG: prepilin-type N-terminal cleavage/methylation domain-containing protein [Tepidisphaeraceae bacterium]